MAQQQNPRSRLIQIFLIYMLGFMALQYFMPRQPPAPANPQQVWTQAQAAEQFGRQPADAAVSENDRKKKLEEAIGKYDEFYRAHEKQGPGPLVDDRYHQHYQARFQQVNIYEHLANREKHTGSTHWLDQAQAKLKEMEKGFHGKAGKVELEINGKTVTREGDLGRIATERLHQIQQARDVVNQDKVTYKIFHFLVATFGGQKNPYSYFWALVVVVLVLKTLSYPFQKKQYQSQRDMARVAPLIKEAQEKMKGRPPEEINKRVFEIYKENNVNLTAGCLPMLVMMFVLLPVYWMIADYEYQFINGHFIWIGTEYSRAVWWMADHLGQFDVPLFIVYLVSNVLSMLIMPKPTDPQQAQQQKMMLIMMPIMMAAFAWFGQWSSAFMLYILVVNAYGMWQSAKLMKQFGLQGAASAGPGLVESAPVVETKPLEPMKGVHTERKKNGKNGRNGRRHPLGQPDRIQPKKKGARESPAGESPE